MEPTTTDNFEEVTNLDKAQAARDALNLLASTLRSLDVRLESVAVSFGKRDTVGDRWNRLVESGYLEECVSTARERAKAVDDAHAGLHVELRALRPPNERPPLSGIYSTWSQSSFHPMGAQLEAALEPLTDAMRQVVQPTITSFLDVIREALQKLQSAVEAMLFEHQRLDQDVAQLRRDNADRRAQYEPAVPAQSVAGKAIVPPAKEAVLIEESERRWVLKIDSVRKAGPWGEGNLKLLVARKVMGVDNKPVEYDDIGADSPKQARDTASKLTVEFPQVFETVSGAIRVRPEVTARVECYCAAASAHA